MFIRLIVNNRVTRTLLASYSIPLHCKISMARVCTPFSTYSGVTIVYAGVCPYSNLCFVNFQN